MSRQLREHTMLLTRKFVKPIPPRQHNIRIQQHQPLKLASMQQVRPQRYRSGDVVR
jgi:hypothetical protein